MALASLLIAVSPGGSCAAEDAEVKQPVQPRPASVFERKVQAAFLAKFPLFVKWSEQSFSDAEAPLKICIFGEDPFGSEFDQAITYQQAHGRTIELSRPQIASESEHCHIVFIGAAESEQVDDILEASEGKSVLTVANIPGFASRGGIVNFFREEGRVRFEINVESAERAGLEISSQLLKLARIVGEPGG